MDLENHSSNDISYPFSGNHHSLSSCLDSKCLYFFNLELYNKKEEKHLDQYDRQDDSSSSIEGLLSSFFNLFRPSSSTKADVYSSSRMITPTKDGTIHVYLHVLLFHLNVSFGFSFKC